VTAKAPTALAAKKNLNRIDRYFARAFQTSSRNAVTISVDRMCAPSHSDTTAAEKSRHCVGCVDSVAQLCFCVRRRIRHWWPDEVEPDNHSEAARRYDGHRSRAVTRYWCESYATGLPLNPRFGDK
jgi:hypothetical protein